MKMMYDPALYCLSVWSILGCKRTVVWSQGPSRFHLAGSKSWFLLPIFAWSDWPWMKTSSFLSPDNHETFVWQFRLPSPRSKVETTLCATYICFIYWLIYLFVSVYIHRWNKTTSLVQATQKALKRENMVKYTPDMADIFRRAVDTLTISPCAFHPDVFTDRRAGVRRAVGRRGFEKNCSELIRAARCTSIRGLPAIYNCLLQPAADWISRCRMEFTLHLCIYIYICILGKNFVNINIYIPWESRTIFKMTHLLEHTHLLLVSCNLQHV